MASVAELEMHQPTSHDEMDKRSIILQACEKKDLDQLRALATSEGGLVDDEVRRKAWPILLGCNSSDSYGSFDSNELPKHRDEEQVQLDVDRSFVYYPEDESDSQKKTRKVELSQLIVAVLRQHPMLHYFQGYHDIVQVFLLVLGIGGAFSAVARLSLLRIRDFMLPTMSGTEPHLRLLPTILHAADPHLAHHLSQTQPFFALPATLTLYAHEIEEYGSIARLFDFLLANEAVIPVYMFAATVLVRKDKLLEIEADEPEMLHSILSKLPRPLDLESLIRRAMQLYQTHPPDRLPGRVWSRISPYSVLKTTRDFRKLTQQTLQEGERLFQLEAAEIRRQEARLARNRRLLALARRYRRPVRYTGLAVCVAIIAMLARGSNSSLQYSSWNTAFVGLQQNALALWQRLTM